MNIDIIKRKLLVKYPLFGSIVANSNFISDSSIETAATDGKNIYYNPKFIETISSEEQIFIFAHEICHIAFNHIFRSEGKDKDLWNTATDSVINALLKKDGLPMVKGVIDIPEAINYDAEEMYKKLLGQGQNQENNNESQSKSNNSNHQNSQNNNQGNKKSSLNSNKNNLKEIKDVGHDTHSMWDKAIEKKYQEEKNSYKEKSTKTDNINKNNESLLDKLNKFLNKKNRENEQMNENEENTKELNQEKTKKEDIRKLTELGEKEFFRQNRIERKKQLEELRNALASASHGHGNTTNSERRSVSNIGISDSLIDFRMLLKEAVKYNVDWSYQNAEIEDGVLTPYLEEIPMPETEIVLDTSGTVNEILLRNFLRECKNILKFSKVKVGCFDTKFYGFTEIKNASDIDNLELRGGGGTNFDVAVNAFSRRVGNKIIFTDGLADMPSTPIDAIWIVFGNVTINPLGGKVIYINENTLFNYKGMRK